MPSRSACKHRQGGARHGRFEAKAEEDDLPVGMLARDFERVERGIDHAHIGAVGLGLQQALLASRARAWRRRRW